MKLAVLLFEAEREKLAPGTKMFIKRAREMGHTVSKLYEYKLQIRYGNSHRIYHDGKPLKKFDAIVVRPGIKADPSIHAAILRQFELEGHLMINGFLGVQRAKNKIRTLQLLDHFGLPIPRTAIIYSKTQFESAMEDFSFPVIVKAAYGSGGSGIFIAESKRSLKPIVEYLLTRGPGDDPIKIQEYIKESKGKDLRIFVVGSRISTSMERMAKKGDFRSNFHKGGSVKAAAPTDEEKRIAIEATKRIGLNFAGVDLLRTNKGPVILEVNSYPGLEGIYKATGHDIAADIIRYIEKKVKKRKGMNGAREVTSNKSEG